MKCSKKNNLNSQKEIRLFYKLGKENNLEPLSESKIKKEKEEIQQVFERNMRKFFPKLEFVKTELSFKDKSRADSLAFNPTEKGHWGIKGWRYIIKNNDDFENFLVLLDSPELLINSLD